MISKKYTLQEAFDKKLLKDWDTVNIRGLYTPCKSIPVRHYTQLVALSLESYFGERFFGEFVEISRDLENMISVRVIKSNTYKEQATLVASKLLSDETHNIKATCKHWYDEEWEFRVVLNPDIIVRFEGEEENAFLELPVHAAYTC